MEAAARGCREHCQPPPCRLPRTAATTVVTAFALAQGFARAWGRRKRVLTGSPCGAPHRCRFLCRTGILGRCRRVASLCVIGGMRTDGVAVPLCGQVPCRASPGSSAALAAAGGCSWAPGSTACQGLVRREVEDNHVVWVPHVSEMRERKTMGNLFYTRIHILRYTCKWA
jgi:hypothetical protein